MVGGNTRKLLKACGSDSPGTRAQNHMYITCNGKDENMTIHKMDEH